MRTKLAAVTTAAAIGIGGFAVAAVNPLGVAGAQDAPAEAPGADRNGPLAQALDALVADGTLTEAQAAAVTEGVGNQVAEGRQDRKDRRADTLQVVADTLGSSPDEVRAGLGDATSIAAQAEAAGVDRQAVDDALTAVLGERIDAAAEAGKLTEAQAVRGREKLDAMVESILDADGSRPGRGGSGGLRHRSRERRGN